MKRSVNSFLGYGGLSALVIATSSWLGASPAAAVPITFQVDYVTTSGQNCSRSFCFPITPGGTFQKTFTLDSADLASGGSFDVSSSLLPAFVIPPGTTSSTNQAHAIVAGGAVTDLTISFNYSGSNTIPFLGTTSFSSSFQESAGHFATSDSSFNSGIPTSSSGNSAGTYVITQVPEPGTLSLVLLGGAVLASRRRRP